jgi:hypothetical protein
MSPVSFFIAVLWFYGIVVLWYCGFMVYGGENPDRADLADFR